MTLNHKCVFIRAKRTEAAAGEKLNRANTEACFHSTNINLKAFYFQKGVLKMGFLLDR